MSGSGVGVKRKRVVLSIATKLQIVERTENGESIAKLSLEFNMGNQTGKLKPKKLDRMLSTLTHRDLGPYGSGSYTSPSGVSIDLQHISISELEPEINSNKVIVGRVVCSVDTNTTVPFTFCLCDQKSCIPVTVYNLIQGGGFKIGDSVAIPEPFVQVVHVDHVGKTYDFQSVRVDSPLVLVVNGNKLKANKQSFSVLAVSVVPE